MELVLIHTVEIRSAITGKPVRPAPVTAEPAPTVEIRYAITGKPVRPAPVTAEPVSIAETNPAIMVKLVPAVQLIVDRAAERMIRIKIAACQAVVHWAVPAMLARNQTLPAVVGREEVMEIAGTVVRDAVKGHIPVVVAVEANVAETLIVADQGCVSQPRIYVPNGAFHIRAIPIDACRKQTGLPCIVTRVFLTPASRGGFLFQVIHRGIRDS